MKIDDYRKVEDNLKKAVDALTENYEVNTTEDENWSNRHRKVTTEIIGLLEEMIFTFKIED